MGKTALILEGGALRTFYTMGVLDVFLEAGITFDYVCGVSGGALCAVNYLAGQYGRTVSVNLRYLHDKRYMSLNSLVMNKAYFNLEFLFSSTVESWYPLDDIHYEKNPTRFEVGITDLSTGEIDFVPKPVRDDFAPIVATASVPFLARPIEIGGRLYLDGGIGDSIPYQRALDLGCTSLVVVTTQDHDYRKQPLSGRTKQFIRQWYRKYPRFAQTLMARNDVYNQTKAAIATLAEKGQLLLLEPLRKVEVSRAEQNKNKLIDLYQEGVDETIHRLDMIVEYLKQAGKD